MDNIDRDTLHKVIYDCKERILKYCESSHRSGEKLDWQGIKNELNIIDTLETYLFDGADE
jgi:hypothetical protein